MEWLINRRRMMFNKSVPPTYLTFEDAEVWRICCENWGDYNETVITDNGDNTVDIVTTFKSMRNTVVKKSEVISTQTNVDNSGGTYTPGTTKEAVGITVKQCGAVTNIAPKTSGGPFTSNSTIKYFDEFQYFTKITNIYSSAFSCCTSLEKIILPNSLKTINGPHNFQLTKLPKIEFPEGFTSISGTQQIWGCQNGIIVIFPSTVTNLDRYSMSINSNSTKQSIVICKAITPPTINNNISYPASIGAVYVPDESVDTYKEATRWSAIASKIHPISEYVES